MSLLGWNCQTPAARLIENPNIPVGVIEAGQIRLTDPNILVSGCKFTILFGAFILMDVVVFVQSETLITTGYSEQPSGKVSSVLGNGILKNFQKSMNDRTV